MRDVGSRVEKCEGQLNRIENNLATVIDLMQTFVHRAKDLERKEEEHVATSKDVSQTSPERSQEASDCDEDNADGGDDDHREGGASSVPEATESRQDPVGLSAVCFSPDRKMPPAKVVEVQAELLPRRPPTTSMRRSPPKMTPGFFSGEETEEEVPLLKVTTPKKSRPFANMAMPQKPLAGQDGLWRCNICNVSTFRSQSAFDRHWNLHRREGGLECHVCRKILSDR